jgi:hypothetical protein
MCCMLTTLVMAGPRLAIIIWWLFATSRFNDAFNAIIWPILGIIFAPWTTLMYVILYKGGITGLDWLWMGLAILIDLGSYAGGGWGNRDRLRG